jgi:hypothetical protein
MRKHKTFGDLPLFASDDAISEVLMGAGKAKDWLAILPLLERRGFPAINGLLGGRYTPPSKRSLIENTRFTANCKFTSPTERQS